MTTSLALASVRGAARYRDEFLDVRPGMYLRRAPAALTGAGFYTTAPDASFEVRVASTIGGIGALLGPSAAIVRAMPNTPAAVRQGVTVGCPSPEVSAAQKA